ncbi:uncharacterized protein LOC125748926 [Brienomyrus brachyistius]|uniref:uncharacterized protein LOC125748926 n=1 Tax=Brienomyrus brachyistius TaxID=42636 RepID=UPI0020B42191|nr:uncharacterized protein LOC125748926 [Brienomyrus brachyistius]
MFRIHCLLICPFVFHACGEVVRFLSPGDNVSLPCDCSEKLACQLKHLRWIRFTANRLMEIINTGDKTNNSRFCVRDNVMEISEMNSQDSGRYYCVEHSYSYLSFLDNGTVLQVGDVWTNESKLLVMKDKSGNRTEKGSRLQCVATGLVSPWVNVTWHFSGMHGEGTVLGQTRSFMEPSGKYCVISERIPPPWLVELLSEDGAALNDDVLDEVGVWWCELQTGKNSSVKSQLFGQQTRSEWCIPVISTVLALCILFVSLASITCFNLLHRSPDSVPQETLPSPSHGSRDGYTDVTYTHLDFKKASQNGRRHAEKGRRREEDRMVYSEVRYNC